MLLWKQVACVIQLLHFSNAVPSRQNCKTSTCKQSISNLRLLSSPNCHSGINVGVCASGPKHELCHEQCYTWHLKGSLTKQFTMHLWHTSYYTDITLKWGSLRCEMRSQGQYRVGGRIWASFQTKLTWTTTTWQPPTEVQHMRKKDVIQIYDFTHYRSSICCATGPLKKDAFIFSESFWHKHYHYWTIVFKHQWSLYYYV